MNTELKIVAKTNSGFAIGNDKESICLVWDNNQESERLSNLIIDSNSTFQSCGLLPSELLKHNQRMREMLENIYNIENGAFGLKSFNVEDLKRKIKRVIESTNP